MDADPRIVAAYRRGLRRRRQQVEFKRPSGEAPNVTYSGNATVYARVWAPSAGELQGGESVHSHRCIVLHEDLANEGFPVPPIASDIIVTADQTLTIQLVDAETRSLAGAYVIQASG